MTEAWKLSEEQRELVERFEAAYNAIDRFLRKALGKDRSASFVSVVVEYDRSRRRLGSDGDYLRMAAELRNVLVHQKTEPHQHLAVPTLPVVRKLESLCKRFTDPPLVVPRFQRRVETVTMDESLAKVLRLISQREYSQFPVYDGEKFRGLLTENGVTRWLAHHVSKEMSLIELDEVPVKQVLPEEEKRPNWLFIPRTRTVDEVRGLFAERELLEAVLVSESGNRAEKLLGIVTRWDVIHER